jgi:BMFP domain-containing protein YqiC
LLAQFIFMKQIFAVIIKYFWPWFLEYVWPLILKHLLSLIDRSLGDLSKKVAKTFDNRMQKGAAEAMSKVEEATAAASISVDPVEREKNEQIARIWREVAEKFRSENEILKAQLTELSARNKQSLQDDVRQVVPTLENIDSVPSVAIAGKLSQLPALPNEIG